MTGQIIQNYRIGKLIGEGGMGNVYLGSHNHIERKVAIKVLNPNLARNPEIRERFKNEAATLSKLHHPNIVELYDYVESPRGLFLMMEFAEGLPLDRYIQEITGPVPENKAVPLFDQILQGVAYAHERGVVHRDIKPSNIIINPDGKVKILDFGIAKIVNDPDHKLTKTGTKLGTVLYMSPEQVKGKDVDKRTDIYSLGITLFQILTGKCPYNDELSEYEVYKQIVEEPLPSARSIYPGVTHSMEMVIKKASEKNPDQRFSDCEEFRKAIESPALLRDTHIATTAGPPVQRSVTKPGRQKRSGWLIFWNIFFPLLFTLGIAGSIAGLISGNDERYVIANKLWLRSSKTADSNNGTELLSFGDKVLVTATDKTEGEDGVSWIEVRSESGKKGFVASEYVAGEADFERIRSVFDEEGRKETGAVFKMAIIRHLGELKSFSNDNISEWKVNASSANSDTRGIVQGDFNADGITDLACIAVNYTLNQSRLLVFAGSKNSQPEIIHEEEFAGNVQLKKMPKGSRLFTGKQNTEYVIDGFGNIYQQTSKVYRTLSIDSFLIVHKNGGNKYLYLWNKSAGGFGAPEKIP